VIEAFRATLLGTSGVQPGYYALSVGVTLVVAAVGVGCYQRLARDFVDYA
jgi:ABC-type polysaccharide/polyol phosphate export permease